MTEEILTKPGDTIQIIGGGFKGEKGSIIAVYNNSCSIELEKSDSQNKPRKTVISHKNYKIIT